MPKLAFAMVLLAFSLTGVADPVKCSDGRRVLYQEGPCPSGFSTGPVAGVLSVVESPPPTALPSPSAGTGSALGGRRAKTPRNPANVREFRNLSPCPSTTEYAGPCPGWVVDHVVALACGGLDDFRNMQWQTVADAKRKDRWELLCR